MRCPVCKRKVKTVEDYVGGTLCEEYGGCRCGYYYQFLYGFTHQHFGPMSVVNGYNFTKWQSKRSEWLEWLYCKVWRFVTLDGCI